MFEETFVIECTQIEFINQFEIYGFKNKNDLINTALEKLKQELEHRELERSAELYAEIYEEDKDLQELTESALIDE